MKPIRRGVGAEVEVASLGFPPEEERSMEEAIFPLLQPSQEGIEVTRSMDAGHPRTAIDVREHGSPEAPGHPDDLKNCDLAAMEEKLLGVMYATDDWIDPAWEENAPPRNMSVLDGNQQRVEKWWVEKAPKSIRPSIQPFLKNSLARAESGQTEDGALRKALGIPSEEGNTKLAEEAARVLEELDGTTEVGRTFDVHLRQGGESAVRWGTTFTTDEYQSTEPFVGNLAFNCIDFGGNLKLPTILQQKLRVGEEIEPEKCTVLALAAGAEWVAQGQPKRCPSRRRIDLLASDLRLDEYLNAEQGWGQSADEKSEVAKATRSIRRDASTAGRERGYQALGLFLLPAMWKCIAGELVVMEILNRDGAVFHTYTACPVSNGTVIFSISHQ